jgi:NAD(P)H-dependent FMN reductase
LQVKKLKIAIILGTTRRTRFADRPAKWLLDMAAARDDATFELVDLRDYPMPFFEDETSPARKPPNDENARRWGQKMAEYDGFIFITAEYNHSISGVLKNALDYAYNEFVRKPATFLGYGGVGAARAVEQLRLILAEMQVASLKHAVHINGLEFLGMLRGGKDFSDYPYLAETVPPMLDNLVWWARTLKVGREGKVLEPAAQSATLKA